MPLLKKFIADLIGVWRVLGFVHAARWGGAIVVRLPEIYATRNLQSADRAMGPGPYCISASGSRSAFRVVGPDAFSGIREMYVRDAYLRHGTLGISDGDIVVDLGANMGNFTNLALAHGPKVMVIAVEPNRTLNERFLESVALNPGFTSNVTLVRAFLGVPCDKQTAIGDHPDYRDAPYISESDLIRRADIKQVDFLKCDIEGGEFGLLGADSALLKMARKLAIEVHSFAGNVEKFVELLRQQGFDLKHVKRDPDGTATILAARR